MKTTKISDIKRATHEIDAEGQTLGRLATKIANLLVGKSKPYFVRHLDCGDSVTVKNNQKIKVTGKKETGKVYTRYSGFAAGLRKETLGEARQKNSSEIIRRAVWGMLPNNHLRSIWINRLKFK